MLVDQSKTVVAFIPLPPPYAGPEIITSAIFDGLELKTGWHLIVVKSNVRFSNENKGQMNLSGIFVSLKTLSKLFGSCLQRRPQIVYFLLSSSKMGFLRDFFVIMIAKIFRCKVIAHYHGSNFHKFYENAGLFYRCLIRLGLMGVNSLIVQAKILIPTFCNIYPQKQLRVLYNGLPHEIFSRASHFKRKIDKNKVRILFLSHICFTKGFYDLILAYEKLRDSYNNIELCVAGDLLLNPSTQKEFLSGEHRVFYEKNYANIHQKIKCSLEDRSELEIEYKGFVQSEMKFLLYEESDIYVLPSYTEGFPVAMLEAMAFGLSLIVTPTGAIPEVIQEEENALFVRPGDTSMLQQKLERLVIDEALRVKMGEKNRELALNKFGIQTVQEQFTNIVFA